MTEASVLAFDRAAFQWHAVGELMDGFQVKVTMDTTLEDKGTGPFAMVVDEPPASGGTGTGPSPVNLALGALAACTVVTVAGVARRRNMDVRSIRVEIDANKVLGSKQEAEEAAAHGMGTARRCAHKRLIVTGEVSAEELAILERAAKYCPVGRLFREGWLVFAESAHHEGQRI